MGSLFRRDNHSLQCKLLSIGSRVDKQAEDQERLGQVQSTASRLMIERERESKDVEIRIRTHLSLFPHYRKNSS